MRKFFFVLISAALFLIPQSGMAQQKIVDLGLSVKWADCNLGAKSPEETGDFYAWGETEVAPFNSLVFYKWGEIWERASGEHFLHYTKYNVNKDYGVVDGKTRLDPEDDAAHVKLGGKWRMPTREEIIELAENCTKTDCVQKGINGVMFKSKKNGNTIFLPFAGYRVDGTVQYKGERCMIWASDLATNFNGCARSLELYKGASGFGCNGFDTERYFGLPIRPVCP